MYSAGSTGGDHKLHQMMGKTMEDIRKEYEPQAIEGIKSRLALEAVIKAEKIEATDKEIEEKINLINKEINEKELEEHKLELDKQNIFPKIDRLANIQEELEYSLEEYNELKNNSEIIEIAKEYLEKAYKNMKENVTPKFSKELSQTISNISDGKYKNMKITDNDIMVEVENGDYVSASLLSEGTIDQLYFSLRMAILKEISNETLPIFLDESFVFFDKNRLINTINYLNSNHNNQIIIFSCTEREKDILDYLNIKYNLIAM